MASNTAVLRTCLNAGGLIKVIRKRFDQIVDTRHVGSLRYSLSDTLMSALAMFQFKFPSLLQFGKATREHSDTTVLDNLKRLYWVADVPFDSPLRDILDEVPPSALRPAFRRVQSAIRRGRTLVDYPMPSLTNAANLDAKYRSVILRLVNSYDGW